MGFPGERNEGSQSYVDSSNKNLGIEMAYDEIPEELSRAFGSIIKYAVEEANWNKAGAILSKYLLKYRAEQNLNILPAFNAFFEKSEMVQGESDPDVVLLDILRATIPRLMRDAMETTAKVERHDSDVQPETAPEVSKTRSITKRKTKRTLKRKKKS